MAVQSITSGAELQGYLKDVAEEFDISSNIRFNTSVTEINWNSSDACWEVTVSMDGNTRVETMRFQFVINGNGYFDLRNPHVPNVFKTGAFRGEIIHSSKLTSTKELEGKNVCLVGSGATATTMVPDLLNVAKSMSWCIRSSSHTIPLFRYPRFFDWFHSFLVRLFKRGITLPYRLYRAMMLFWIQAFIQMWVHYVPKSFREWFYRKWNGTKPEVYETFFNPQHRLGEQRLCMFQDMHECLEDPKLSMHKGDVSRLTSSGLEMNGKTAVDADVIVLATGYDLSYFKFDVKLDGTLLHMPDQVLRRELLFEQIPNLFLVTLFNRLTPKTTTSGTPNLEQICKTICTIIKYTQRQGKRAVLIKPTAEPVSKIIPMEARYITRNTSKCFRGVKAESDGVCSWRYMFIEQPFRASDYTFS